MQSETVNEKWTTHNFIHENALKILMNDLGEKSYFGNLDGNAITKVNKVLESLLDKKEVFQNYANFPDEKERDYSFEVKKYNKNGIQVKRIRWPIPAFSNHFFSPHQAASYTYKIFNDIYKLIPSGLKEFFNDFRNQGIFYNAMKLFLLHTENAINNYYRDGNVSEDVIKELSKACHYIEDMNQTHHVTNNIAFFSNHKKFEQYANLNKDLFTISSAKEFCRINSLKPGEKQFWGKYNFYLKFINIDYLINRSGIDALMQACSWRGVYSSCFATGVDDLYSNNINEGLEHVSLYCGDDDVKNVLISKNWERASWALSNDKEKWQLNIEQTLKMAQISVASYIFIFFLYIAEPNIFSYQT